MAAWTKIAAALAVALSAAPGLAFAQDGGVAALLPHDLSPWGMISNADWVVQGVVAGLVLASVLTWTIALAKTLEIVAAGRRTRAGLAALQGSRSLDEAVQRVGTGPGACPAMVTAARDEVTASLGAMSTDGVKERVAWRLERLVAGAGRSMGRGTGLLATIGATAPFVGLFGTVWGIMNAFIGISRSQTTNLAVVAPGIAEALLATAIGLVAAIPAVVIYNLFARAIAGQKAQLADVVAGTMGLLSRDLDRRPDARLRLAGE